MLRAPVTADTDALGRMRSEATVAAATFLRFAYRHQLGTYAYWTLHALRLTERLPAKIRAAARAAALRRRIRHFAPTSDEYELVPQILGVVTDLHVGKLTLHSLVDVYHVVVHLDARRHSAEFLACREREHIGCASAFVLLAMLDVLDRHRQFASLTALLERRRRSLPAPMLTVRTALNGRSRSHRSCSRCVYTRRPWSRPYAGRSCRFLFVSPSTVLRATLCARPPPSRRRAYARPRT